MGNFIFFTNDGDTYDNLHKPTNNMQVLGDANGDNIDEAFKCFKINQSYLSTQEYKNVMAIQTVGDVIMNLEL